MDFPQPDITYYLGTGPVIIPDGFRNDQPQCTVTYSLRQEGRTGYDQTIYDFMSDSAVITIDTADMLLDMQEQTLILTATSDLSQKTARQVFTVTFIDGCRDASLSKPRFSDLMGDVQLYEAMKFFFTESVASVENCGEITYRLINDMTGQELPKPEFTIDLIGTIPSVRVLLTSSDFAMNSPYDIVVEARLSDYATVLSDPLMLMVADPCYDTILIDQMIPSFVAQVDDPVPKTYKLPLFKDFVSNQYRDFGDGTGTGLCGMQTYEIYEIVNGSRKIVPFAFLTYIGDQATINVQSFDTADIGLHQMIIEVMLPMYNKLLQSEFEITVVDDRICTITALRVAPGQDFSIDYEIMDPPQPLIQPFP